MPYIGNEVGNRFVASKAASVYSGNGSTTAFTLEHAVGSDEDILVSVDGVIQEPSVAYAVSSGTTLTFTAAPSSNSGNNIFVYYLFRTVATVDHPSTSSLQATDATFTSTLNVTGETTLATHLNMGDSDKIKLGASGDLEIYHDASNSYVDDTGTGRLYLRGNDRVQIQKYTGEDMVTAIADGAVNLYHNNSKKFETTSSGVTVTGNVVSNDGSNNARFQFDNNNQILIQNDTAMNFYVNGNNNLKIDSTGAVTKPLQPAFLARPASDQDGIAINADIVVAFGTEIFDQNADFSSNTFTAPVDGRYHLDTSLYCEYIDTGTNLLYVTIVTSNRTYYNVIDPNFSADALYWTFLMSVLADMDANDTAQVKFTQIGGTAQANVNTGSHFSGYLVC